MEESLRWPAFHPGAFPILLSLNHQSNLAARKGCWNDEALFAEFSSSEKLQETPQNSCSGHDLHGQLRDLGPLDSLFRNCLQEARCRVLLTEHVSLQSCVPLPFLAGGLIILGFFFDQV